MRLFAICALALLPVTILGRSQTSVAQAFENWSPLCDGFDQTAGIAIADLDGDRDLDLVFANGMHRAQTDWAYSNDGKGRFYGRRSLGTGSLNGDDPDPSFGIAVADLDGDSALDVVVANDFGGSPVYRNDGKGQFSRIAVLGDYLVSQPRRAVALGDLDGDRDVDAILVGLGQDHIYFNDGSGRRWTEQPLGSRRSGYTTRATAVAVADVDRDGDLDIVLPARGDVRSVIFINDGRGGFAHAVPFDEGPEDTTGVAVGDVDGDGDQDIIAGNWEQPHLVHINDGRGKFTKGTPFGSGREQTWTVALGDMDRDGDLDALVGNVNIGFWDADIDGDRQSDQFGHAIRNEPSRIYLNDGRGQFSPGSPLSTGTDQTRPIAVGDLDGDGDLDVVMGNTCQPNLVLFNPLRRTK